MPYKTMREILKGVGLPEPAEGMVSIAGSDPVVRTRYRVGTAGAAAQAAIGVAVSELWKTKGGRDQKVGVDVRAATFSLRGSKHTFVDDKCITEIRQRDPFFRFYPVKDCRWVRFHTSYPHHLEAVKRILGDPKNYDAAAKITLSWDGKELEDAVHAGGGVAALVRSPDEWARHPQYAAVAEQPLVEIRKIGDAPRQALPAGDRPLAGVRALDLTRVLAGPTCARTLAEHGADVLKINASHLPDAGVGELDTGLGKLSALLDLRTSEGVETLRGLVRDADVFSQGYRPGSLAARGFSPEDAARLRPGIVYVELSAWGWLGPWSGRRGYDTIVSSVTGMVYTQGNGKEPVGMPVSALDYVTGYLMALGVMTALHRRVVEGGSWLVRASLARTALLLEQLGLLDPSAIANAVAEPPPDEIERLSWTTESPVGRVRHLKPALELSETPPFWSRPPVPLGYHQPIWPARNSLSEVHG